MYENRSETDTGLDPMFVIVEFLDLIYSVLYYTLYGYPHRFVYQYFFREYSLFYSHRSATTTVIILRSQI